MIRIALNDMRLAVRSGGGFGLALGFLLIAVTLIPFGVGPEAAVLSRLAPGLLWVMALLACLLSLERIFAVDREDGSLEILATAPVPLEAVALGKAAAHWVTTGLPLALAAPAFGILLGLEWPGHLWLGVSLMVGTPALSLIGTFAAALTVGLKRGGLLLSLLVLPFHVPTLIFGAEVARRGADGVAVGTPLALLGAVTLGCLGLLPFAAAGALRASLR